MREEKKRLLKRLIYTHIASLTSLSLSLSVDIPPPPLPTHYKGPPLPFDPFVRACLSGIKVVVVYYCQPRNKKRSGPHKEAESSESKSKKRF